MESPIRPGEISNVDDDEDNNYASATEESMQVRTLNQGILSSPNYPPEYSDSDDDRADMFVKVLY